MASDDGVDAQAGFDREDDLAQLALVQRLLQHEDTCKERVTKLKQELVNAKRLAEEANLAVRAELRRVKRRRGI